MRPSMSPMTETSCLMNQREPGGIGCVLGTSSLALAHADPGRRWFGRLPDQAPSYDAEPSETHRKGSTP